MDELDKLKTAWKSQDYSKDQVSQKELYKMLLAKSSSYVKWIFYISILEFSFVTLLNLIVDTDEYNKAYDQMGMHNMILVITVLSYIIMLVFIYLFYVNYKKINVTANAKTLMQNILNTRKTVKTYIYINIGYMMMTSLTIFYTIFSSKENTATYKIMSDIPEDFSTNTLIILVTVVMLIFLCVLLGIYRLIYGILLRRLKKNHKELKQLN